MANYIEKDIFGEVYRLPDYCWKKVFLIVTSRVNNWVNTQASLTMNEDLRRKLSLETEKILSTFI